MKKIIIALVFILGALAGTLAQPTISFRMNNPQIIDNSGDYTLYFEVEIKADEGGWYIAGGQSILSVDLTTFGDPIPAASLDVVKGSLLDGDYSGGPKYGVTYNTNSNKLNFSIDANNGGAGTYPAAYNEYPTDWTQCWIVEIDIADRSGVAHMVFDYLFMDGEMTYVNPASGFAALCNFPNGYRDNMNELLLGKVYDDVFGWTPSDPAAGDDALKYSVWSGTAPISAIQATPAVANYIRLHSLPTLGAAYLSIQPGAGLSTGGLSNPTAEGVEILSDATGTGSLIPTATTGAGTYSVERYLSAHSTTNDTAYWFHQVAAPVANQTLGDWNMIPGQSYAYEYQGDQLPEDAWFNIYNPARTTDPGYGFLLSWFNTNVPQTVTFVDDITTGAVTNLAIYDGAGEFTMIGNPYTSPISFDAFYANNSANIGAAAYIWEPTVNDEGGNYRAYTSGTGGNTSVEFPQVGQSFFVESTGVGSVVNFAAADRTHNDQAYLKNDHINYMRLYTIGGAGTWDELYINFKDGVDATGGFDIQCDAHKWASAYEHATEIYTSGTDGEILTIDTRPTMEDDMISIPVAFKAGSASNYSFGTEFIESFHVGVEIMLEDKNFPGSEWFDMREGANYEFNAAPEDPNDRFVLHFYDQSFGIEDGQSVKPVTIYSYRTDAFIVNNTEQRIKEVLVYDMMGNLILDKVEVNASPLKVYISDRVGYYVVKVITDKAVYSEKVYITN